LRGEPVYRVDSYRYERDPVFEEEDVRFMQQPIDYRERIDPIEPWEDKGYPVESEIDDRPLSVSLPVSMI
jgi:hypothetical protein